MGVIYKISSPSGRIYIGKTINLKRRISDYRFKLNGRSSIIINSIKSHGWAAHKLEVIEDDVPEEKMDEREMFWISELKSYVHHHREIGMNQTLGGDGQRTTWMWNKPLREKMSKKFSGAGNPFYGKHHTEAVRSAQAKRAKEFNLKSGKTIPKWGAEKGRLQVIRSVVCYNKNGIFLKEYSSISEASIILNISISPIWANCNGRISNTHGFVFRYKTEKYPLKINVGIVKNKTIKRPITCFIGNKKTAYPSAHEASLDLKIPKTTINRAAQYNQGKPIRAGYVFMY